MATYTSSEIVGLRAIAKKLLAIIPEAQRPLQPEKVDAIPDGMITSMIGTFLSPESIESARAAKEAKQITEDDFKQILAVAVKEGTIDQATADAMSAPQLLPPASKPEPDSSKTDDPAIATLRAQAAAEKKVAEDAKKLTELNNELLKAKADAAAAKKAADESAKKLAAQNKAGGAGGGDASDLARLLAQRFARARRLDRQELRRRGEILQMALRLGLEVLAGRQGCGHEFLALPAGGSGQ